MLVHSRLKPSKRGVEDTGTWIEEEVMGRVEGWSEFRQLSFLSFLKARIDAMNHTNDAQYKELQSRAKQPTPNLDDDDMPMSCEEAKFMQTFLNAVFIKSGKSYNPPDNPDDQQNNSENPINFDSDDEDDEPTPQPKTQPNKTVKETPLPKPYKPKILSAMIQNKVPPKLEKPRSFLILCNFKKTFSCNALTDLGASINLMPYSIYAKLYLKTLKPTKMSVRLADRSFQYPVGIAENMLVEVGKFTFPADFAILEMEEDNIVPLILGRPFLHTADAVYFRDNRRQLNVEFGTRNE
ncbi:reverse transcriptase domain-containing protein [Tanacetum coccineum]|uniref:Reverse transcriptase domain-containing protein n=1 Tax=Tanacetum coccineum TaxID=301880 RepID=A0ABQ4YH52_9ASTR